MAEVYLVMELVEGQEMFNYLLEVGNYNEKIARFLFKELL